MRTSLPANKDSESASSVKKKLEQLKTKLDFLRREKSDQMKEISFLKNENLNLKDELNFVSSSRNKKDQTIP
jgi:predicted nuclease with TOPRIM domain